MNWIINQLEKDTADSYEITWSEKIKLWILLVRAPILANIVNDMSSQKPNITSLDFKVGYNMALKHVLGYVEFLEKDEKCNNTYSEKVYLDYQKALKKMLKHVKKLEKEAQKKLGENLV